MRVASASAPSQPDFDIDLISLGYPDSWRSLQSLLAECRAFRQISALRYRNGNPTKAGSTRQPTELAVRIAATEIGRDIRAFCITLKPTGWQECRLRRLTFVGLVR